MENHELQRRLDFIEFRQELLFSNTPVERLLFEHKVERDQYLRMLDLMDSLRSALDAGEEVHHGGYEQDIYRIVPQYEGNYHFAEDFAQLLHEESKWEEVFVALYGHAPKFQSYLSRT